MRGLAEGSRLSKPLSGSPGLGSTPTRKRSEMLRVLFRQIVANAEWLAQLISLENGKALVGCASRSAVRRRILPLVRAGSRPHDGELNVAPSGANRILVQYQPIGVSSTDHAMEFPRRYGHAQDRACAGGRLHLHPQARRRDAPHGTRDRRTDVGSGHSRRCRQCDHHG